MCRVIILFAAISGFVYQALGAISAHAIQNVQAVQWLKTGLQYQGFHTLVLLFLALMIKQNRSIFWCWSAGLMAVGILLFSGSLYALALFQITLLSYITPVGGVCFLLGWCALFVGALRMTKENIREKKY